jgi:hypothetical protein
MNRRLTIALLGLLVGYVVLGSVYAGITPPFEKPDENWHFAYAMYLASTGQLPVQRLEAPEHLARQEGDQAPLYYGLLAAVIRLMGPERVSRGYETLATRNPSYGYRGPLAPDNDNVFVHGRCEGDCRWTVRAVYAGRGLSLLLGLAALVAAAVALRLIFPAEPALLLAVVGAMAFNPQFLHMASAVSNDVLTVALTAACFASLAAWLGQPGNVRRVWLLGLVGGLTGLSKANALTAVATTGLVLLLASPLPWRRRLRHGALWAMIVLGICGWWYARNWALYGDPTGVRIHLAIYGGHPTPLTWSRFIEEWHGLSDSFWASFGWGGIMFPWAAAYTWMRTGAVVLSLSFVVVLIRRWRGWYSVPRSWRGWEASQRVWVSAAVFDLLLAGALQERFMRLVTAPVGRLLFPVMLPIVSVLMLGLLGNLPPRWRMRVAAVGSLVWAAVAILAILLVIAPAYRVPPPFLDSVPGPVLAEFGQGSVELRDIAWFEGEGVYYVQFLWQVNAPLDKNYSLFVHGLDETGTIVTQRDSHPGRGNHPTTLWRAGESFAETYSLPKADGPISTLAIGFSLGLQDGRWVRLPVSSAGLAVFDDALQIPLWAVRRAVPRIR